MEDKESTYWTVFVGNENSQHIELTPNGTYNVWESKIVKKGLSREESMKMCIELQEVWNARDR